MGSITPEVWIIIAINIVGIAFAAGGLWQRMRSLERTVLNGFSAKLDEHGRQLTELGIVQAEHGVQLNAIESRCKDRGNQIAQIAESMAD